jgi:hypothetical protein
MGILRFLLKTLVVLVCVFFIGGFLLPSSWMVSRSVVINASPEKIYPLISSFKAWTQWSPWNQTSDPSLQYTYDGPEIGVGAKQQWTSDKMGKGWMQLTEANPQVGVAYDLHIDMNGSESTLRGNIAFSSEGDDTKVTWSDEGDAGKSFTKRWMALLFKPMLGRQLNAGLNNLKAVAENH